MASAQTLRLRELSPDAFETFCFELLTARHPGAAIRRASGAGGDKGIEILCGELRGRPVIWHCKHFANGIKGPQRRQIQKSLDTALWHFILGGGNPASCANSR